MTTNDLVSQHLDLIARWLEGNGYAIDVDYATACIVVWLDNWPLVVELQRRSPAPLPGDVAPDHNEP